MEYGRVIQAL